MCAQQPGLFWAATRVWDRQHGPAIDASYLANRRGMAAHAEQIRYRLTYHWLEAGRPMADQVAQVWYCMQGFIAQGEGVMLDCEEALSAAQVVEFAERMEQIVQRPVAVYAARPEFLGSQAIFNGQRPLIFPHYVPDIQESLDLAKSRGARYADAIQWTSGAQVTGVAVRCDADHVGVLDRFEKVCGY